MSYPTPGGIQPTGPTPAMPGPGQDVSNPALDRLLDDDAPAPLPDQRLPEPDGGAGAGSAAAAPAATAGTAPDTETTVDPDPIAQVRRWWEEARASGDRWADAMVVSTASPGGRPSARAVVLSRLDERGFAFVTDTRSDKAAQLAANPQAALTFLWPGTRRQVRVVGRVGPMPDAEVDELFAARPPEANLAALVATQDEVISGRDDLVERLEDLRTVAGDRPVGRPPGGGGYIVAPDEIELWEERPDHIHDRLRYRRTGDGWEHEWLAP